MTSKSPLRRDGGGSGGGEAGPKRTPSKNHNNSHNKNNNNNNPNNNNHRNSKAGRHNNHHTNNPQQQQHNNQPRRSPPPSPHNHPSHQQHYQQKPHHHQNHIPNAAPFGTVPAFLPGASSLVEQLDKRLLIVLRDGRHLIGVLRSFDQFSNAVLEDTSERKLLSKIINGIQYYADMPLGLYLIRGDSVVVLGELMDDDDANDDIDEQNRLDDGTKRGVVMKRVQLEELERLELEENLKDLKLGDGHSKTAVTQWDFDADLM